MWITARELANLKKIQADNLEYVQKQVRDLKEEVNELSRFCFSLPENEARRKENRKHNSKVLKPTVENKDIPEDYFFMLGAAAGMQYRINQQAAMRGAGK